MYLFAGNYKTGLVRHRTIDAGAPEVDIESAFDCLINEVGWESGIWARYPKSEHDLESAKADFGRFMASYAM